MTYSSIVEMTNSSALLNRVAACAADEGFPENPHLWAQQNMWTIAAADSGWAEAWDYARAAGNADDFNPDTGARSDVINDAMILAVVQPMMPAESTP
jgi:pullulanase/glycogen debranching enzyme